MKFCKAFWLTQYLEVIYSKFTLGTRWSGSPEIVGQQVHRGLQSSFAARTQSGQDQFKQYNLKYGILFSGNQTFKVISI